MVDNFPDSKTDKDMRITLIDPSRAPNLKVFFGPDSTYFAIDGKLLRPHTQSS
jgi:hypothetical protein